jgi:hypothetical protein
MAPRSKKDCYLSTWGASSQPLGPMLGLGFRVSLKNKNATLKDYLEMRKGYYSRLVPFLASELCFSVDDPIPSLLLFLFF